MQIFLLFTLIHVTHQFSLTDFADIPEELLKLTNSTDINNIDIESFNEEVIATLAPSNQTQDKEYLLAAYEEKDEEDEEDKKNLKKDKDSCPMDGEEIFQMKLYWKKGTEWQGSKREKAWCAQCDKDCDSGELIRLKECDEDKKDQFWIFDDCSLKPILNPDVCITTGEDKTNSGNQGKIELKTCKSKRDKQQKFRSYDPDDIFEKFNFKLLTQKGKDDRICLSSEHHPRSGEALRFFSCNKAYLNDGGKKKKDDTSHWVVGDFDGHM